MTTYAVTLLDSDGFETARDEEFTIKDAKARAKYLLSDDFAFAVGSTHADMDTKKVEVWNDVGECLWDAFR